MKKILLIALVVLVAMSFVACKKETSQPITQGGGAMQPGVQQPGMDPAVAIPTVPTERQLIVPDDVKGKWDSIVLSIADKSTNTAKDVTVKLGQEHAIEGTNIKVKAEAFLPDFIMEGAIITSRSAETNNPAAKIVVTEGGEEIFSSWVYSNHPSIHPFQHEKVGITLKGGNKSG